MQPPGCEKCKIKMGNEVSLQRVEGQGTKKCPECGSTDIVRKDDEVYCKKCGFVIDWFDSLVL